MSDIDADKEQNNKVSQQVKLTNKKLLNLFQNMLITIQFINFNEQVGQLQQQHEQEPQPMSQKEIPQNYEEQLKINGNVQQETMQSNSQPIKVQSLNHQEEEQKCPKSVVISQSDIKSFLLADSQITSLESLQAFSLKVIQTIRAYLYLEEVDTCYKLIIKFRDELQKTIENASSSAQALKQSALQKLSQFNQSDQIKSVQMDITEIQRVIKELNDTKGYYTEKKKQYTMHYRKGEDKSLTLKFQTLVQIPLFNLITLFYETQLFPLWFPYCKSATCIHQFTKSKKLSQLVWKSPGPIADRQAFITGFGFNCLEYRETVLILARSVNQLQQYNGIKIPHEQNGRVKLQNKFFGFQMKPISEKLTRVRSIMAFNPNFSWMPQKVLDILTKYFAKDLFEKMMKYAKNFKGTAFERELEKKRETEFYKWIGDKVEQYFKAMKEENDKKKRNKIQAW